MGILQARILEWAAMPSSRGSPQPRDQTRVSCMAGRFFTIRGTREDLFRKTQLDGKSHFPISSVAISILLHISRYYWEELCRHHFKRERDSRTPLVLFFSPPSTYCRCSRWGFPGGSEVKASACNVGDLGSIPGLGRSPGEGNGNPLQCSCLENPTDGGA